MGEKRNSDEYWITAVKTNGRWKPQIWYISKCVQREYQHFWTHIEKKMHEKNLTMFSYLVEGKKILKIKEIDFPLLETKARVKKNAKCQCFWFLKWKIVFLWINLQTVYMWISKFLIDLGIFVERFKDVFSRFFLPKYGRCQLTLKEMIAADLILILNTNWLFSKCMIIESALKMAHFSGVDRSRSGKT